MMPLMDIRDVGRTFTSGGRTVTAVRSMSLTFPGDRPRLITLAGESGCGKSTLAAMALGFLDPTSGEVLFEGRPVTALTRSGRHAFRRKVQAVFQNPFEAFNPFYRVDHTFHLALRQAGMSPRSADAANTVHDALRRVRLDPDRVLGRYAHQLSGGQLQRIQIARALMLKPRLLIADEPVSMIDASLRTLVLKQLVELKDELGVSILYITHDLSTALQISDELLVALRGEIVERGDPLEVVTNPRHPYTRLLVASVPSADPGDRWQSEVPDASV